MIKNNHHTQQKYLQKIVIDWVFDIWMDWDYLIVYDKIKAQIINILIYNII